MGKPADLRRRNSRCNRVNPQVIPTSQEAVEEYERQGGHITAFPVSGRDALENDSVLQTERDQRFNAALSNLEQAYGELMNGSDTTFNQAVLNYIKITRALSA